MWTYDNYNELYHHGVKGQKWGVRRYQNKDGTLTEAGEKRYENSDAEDKPMWQYNELYHHGIKGQKWGVRRYQNEDGSLTGAGRKRYGRMSDEKLEKTLKKQIHNKRAERYGSGNRWMHNYEIGERSQKLRDEYKKNEKKYESSEVVRSAKKQFEKTADELEKKLDSGKIDYDEYDRGFKEANKKYFESLPKKTYDVISSGYANTGKGRKWFVENFVNEGGMSLSIARLQDLGYNEKTAKEFVDRLAKSGRTLAMY